MGPYYIGQTVTLRVVFTRARINVDPGVVLVKVREPDGTEIAHTYPTAIVRDGVGQYHFDFTTTQAGPHVYRWEGQDSGDAVDEGRFHVMPTSA